MNSEVTLDIRENEEPGSDHNVAQAEKIFGKAQAKSGEFYAAIADWSREKGEYHSLELYQYARTLSEDPAELYLLGIIAGTIVQKTAIR